MQTVVILLAVAAAPPAAPAGDMAGFSPAFLERSADPCQDFYQYACGGWMKSHPMPPDRSAWDRYYQLEEQSNAAVQQILEQARAKPKGAIEKQIGAYYAACMDEAGVEARGLAPLAPELARIRAVNDLPSLAKALAHLHAIGAYLAFDPYAGQDENDARTVVAGIDQGGIALADRDDYLLDDARTAARQQRYRKHVAAMFRLAGESDEEAEADAKRVWKVESALAKAQLSRKARREPRARYHRHTRAELQALAPSFPFDVYLREAGLGGVKSLNVAVPDFVRALEPLLKDADLATWRAYLTWGLLDMTASLLPRVLRLEDFDFYQRYLHGVMEEPPRWKMCGRKVNRDLGEAVGRLYVERYFPAKRKAAMRALVDRVREAMAADIASLEWMSAPTRKEALDKVRKTGLKVGNPDRWRDYRSLVVKRDDALGNALRGREWTFRSRMARVGKPVDRAEWGDTPQAIHGYQNSSRNEIVFTAGILQPPFMDPTLGDAVVLGEVGRMIGHELTHGFDDSGRHFDGDGNLRDWWAPEDARAYEQRAQCFVDEYSRFIAVDEVHVDGKLTLGENLADNAGLRLAYAALHGAPKRDPGPKSEFTEDQRFFLAFAQSQCANIDPKVQRSRAATDPHSPPRWRVNGTVQNMEAFAAAFSCQAGAPMAPLQRCRVW